jgi:Family of unknown function (DUF6221)
VTDLVAFLRARLDEDERLATLARPEFFTPECLAVFASAGDAAHVIRHDPARVLREVEAKRAILAEIFNYEAVIDGEWGDCHEADQIAAGMCPDHMPDEIPALRVLAAVYSDHPHFDPAWVMPASG